MFTGLNIEFMRFRIHLQKNKGLCVIPLAYNVGLQAWIYKRVQQADADYATNMHDTGFVHKGRRYKPFTFSRLHIKNYKIDMERELMRINSDAYFDVSIHSKEFAENFLQGIEDEEISLGDEFSQGKLFIKKIEVLPTPTFTETMYFRCDTLLVLSVLREYNGKMNAQYITPTDAEFPEFFAKNLYKKYLSTLSENAKNFVEFSEQDVHIRVLSEPRKQIRTMKTHTQFPIKVRGYTFDFEINAPVELIKCGYYAGFGEKNASGCGFVNVLLPNNTKMVRKHKKWTYEECKKEASKYDSRFSFNQGAEYAYKKSLQNGWLDDFFGVQDRVPMGYYNDYETCKKEASKYSSRNEFAMGRRNAYNWAKKNDWLDDFFGEPLRKKSEPAQKYEKLTFEHCKELAKKSSNRADFRKKHPNACQKSLHAEIDRVKWIDLFVFGNKSPKKEDFDSLLKYVKKTYKSLSEWERNDITSFKLAQKRGWLSAISFYIEQESNALVNIVLGEKKDYTKRHRTSYFYPESFGITYDKLDDVQGNGKYLNPKDKAQIKKLLKQARTRVKNILAFCANKNLDNQKVKELAFTLLSENSPKIKITVLCGERESNEGKRLSHALKREQAQFFDNHRDTLKKRCELFLTKTKI